MKKPKTLISILLIAVLASVSTGAPTPSPSFGTLPKNYQTVIRGYYSMPGHLRDPYSAVYRFETPRKGYVKDGLLAGGKIHYGWIVPVWINAKNGFGGYTGAELFYAMFFSENGNVGDVTQMFGFGRVKFLP